MSNETRISISHESDIVTARQCGRELAINAGFQGSDLTLIATAISEVARNIIAYANHGEIILDLVQTDGRCGICVIAQDEGPGIYDIDQAMQDGFSTGNSLGLGLPGARRLMDEFSIQSQAGKGTVIKMKKWAP